MQLGRDREEAAEAAEAATTTVIMLQSLSLPRPLATRAEHVNCIKPLASGAQNAPNTMGPPNDPLGRGMRAKGIFIHVVEKLKMCIPLKYFNSGNSYTRFTFHLSGNMQ